MILRPAIVADAPALAALHATAFETPWRATDIAALMIGLGGYGVAAESESQAMGFILCRAVAQEAEVLTLATTPVHRRHGVAAALLRAGMDGAAARGASAMFLEVAADNLAAIGLYAGAGFAQIGARRGYYQGREGQIDALVMRRDLNI
jgi:ribosomal-protein-alanine N-acetyltransferase